MRPFGDRGADLVDDHLLARADLALEPPRGDLLLRLHEAVPAFLFDLVRHRLGELVRRRAADRLVFEAADAVERGLVEPISR